MHLKGAIEILGPYIAQLEERLRESWTHADLDQEHDQVRFVFDGLATVALKESAQPTIPPPEKTDSLGPTLRPNDPRYRARVGMEGEEGSELMVPIHAMEEGAPENLYARIGVEESGGGGAVGQHGLGSRVSDWYSRRAGDRGVGRDPRHKVAPILASEDRPPCLSTGAGGSLGGTADTESRGAGGAK